MVCPFALSSYHTDMYVPRSIYHIICTWYQVPLGRKCKYCVDFRIATKWSYMFFIFANGMLALIVPVYSLISTDVITAEMLYYGYVDCHKAYEYTLFWRTDDIWWR